APGWRAISDDPNGPAALAARQAILDESWEATTPDRRNFLVEACRSRRVLDLGCAGQGTRVGDPAWLHGQLTAVASSCVGADHDIAGIESMRAGGYDAVVTDVALAADELLALEPFDVVVAGELIEHLDRPADVLDLARQVLAPDGSLIVTTPNPFSLGSVAASRSRRQRENCDHTVLLSASGMVELADRHGFELVEHRITEPPSRRLLVVRAVKAELWHLRHRDRPRPPWIVPLRHVLAALPDWDGGQLGETSIFVLRTKDVAGRDAPH
nr:class I SAM-dependent methyltransferase [Actinomycetota bacterium]